MKNKKLAIGMCMMILLVGIVYASSFTDNFQGDFNNGTYQQTFYNTSGFVQLNATYNDGTFTSRIFDVGNDATWNNISWLSNAIGELPNNQAIETSFGSGNANMTENVLLVHFNNDSTYGENDTHIYDFSGNGNNGTWNGDVSPDEDSGSTSSGKLRGAFMVDGVGDYIDFGNDASLNPEYNNFTIEMWMKVHDVSGNQGVLTKGYTSAYGVFHTAGNDELGLYLQSGGDHNGIVITSYYNQWIHVVWTIDNEGDKQNSYLNGIFDHQTLYPVGNVTSTYNLNIGRYSSAGSGYFNGSIDEVAIYNRILSPTEILDHYKRGALRLNITFQSCTSSNCSDGSWQDVNDISPQNLNVDNNTYFQYKFNFETDNISYSPNLYNVTIDYTVLCIPNLVNTSGSDWINISCLSNNKMNQSRERIQYDANNCGRANQTFTEYRATENCNYTPPSCNNGWKDQDESDVDCGGICGNNCNDTQMCNTNDDCLNSACESGICVSCFDNVKNQDEGDTDCGGVCGNNCNDSKTCNLDLDCSSGFCENNICVSCSDGLKNNNETDIDCGGSNCAGCAIGKNCTQVSDCDGATSCSDGVCCSCLDGILNQGEDLVDCGGHYCGACQYLLYLYDDCGNPTNETHLVQGIDFTFVGGINSSLSDSEKSVSYHNDKVIYRYPIDYMYDYKVKIKLLQPLGGGVFKICL